MADVLILGPAISALHGLQVSRLDLAPQTARYLAVTQLTEGVAPSRPVSLSTVAVSSARLLIRADDLIFSILDGLAPEDVVEFMATGALIRPLPNSVEHDLLDLDALVTDGWVMESAEDVVDNFVDGDAGVFPGVEYTSIMHTLVRRLPVVSLS